MTNPFQTSQLLKSLSNYPVSKGDLPGHPFRGNQWSDRDEKKVLGDAEHYREADWGVPAAQRSRDMFPTSGQPTSAQLRDLAQTHSVISECHPPSIITNQRAEDDYDEPEIESSPAAWDAHDKVTDMANALADKLDAGGTYTADDAKNLHDAISDAADASKDVQYEIDHINDEPDY